MSHRRIDQSFRALILVLVSASSILHSEPSRIRFDFNDLHDRVWVGRRFWAIPLEDWRIRAGRIECAGRRPEMRVNLLNPVLAKRGGDLELSVRMGMLQTSEIMSSAGLRIGIRDPEDADARAACYFGRGIDASIDTVLFVVDPSFDSIALAEKVRQRLIKDPDRVIIVLNKIDSKHQTKKLEAELSKRWLKVVDAIPYDPGILEAGLQGNSLQSIFATHHMDNVLNLILSESEDSE